MSQPWEKRLLRQRARELKIIRLRRAGWTCAEMAERLGLAPKTVANLMSQLIREGMMTAGGKTRRHRAKPRKGELAGGDRRHARDQRIMELRLAGRKNAEIAKLLGLTHSQVDEVTARLVREGRVPDMRGRHCGTLPEVKAQRESTIVRMWRQGATLAAIGEKLGLTRERVRQLIAALETIRGPLERPLRLATVARRLGVTTSGLQDICRSAGIQPDRELWGLPGFSEEAVRRLRRIAKKYRPRTCCLCGRTYLGSASGPAACSTACAEERFRELPPLPAWRPTLQRREKELIRAMQSATRPLSDEWLPVAEAAQRSGLSRRQLYHLATCGLLAARLTKVPPGNGRSIWLYAATEVAIAGQVYAQAQPKSATVPSFPNRVPG